MVRGASSAERRYARVAGIPRIGQEGLASLHSTRVAIVGLGNVGGQLAEHLALLGVPLVLVDRDRVEESNLATQAFAQEHIGLPKVEARARALERLNPGCRIERLDADVRHLGLGALHQTRLLFSCVDSRATRVVLNEVATRLGVPWIDGALDGSGRSWFGRVAAYDPRNQESGCYLCPYSGAALAHIVREATDAPGCSFSWGEKDGAPPTLAISALGAAVASIQALWGLRVLLNEPGPVAGREVYFDLGDARLTTHKLPRNRRCVFDHRTYALTRLGLGVEEATIDQTFATAEHALGGPVSFELQRRTLVGTIACPECGATRRLMRLSDAIGELDARCDCGGTLQPVAGNLLDRFGRAEASEILDRTWAEIGMPEADVVVAERDGRELCLLVAPE